MKKELTNSKVGKRQNLDWYDKANLHKKQNANSIKLNTRSRFMVGILLALFSLFRAKRGWFQMMMMLDVCYFHFLWSGVAKTAKCKHWIWIFKSFTALALLGFGWASISLFFLLLITDCWLEATSNLKNFTQRMERIFTHCLFFEKRNFRDWVWTRERINERTTRRDDDQQCAPPCTGAHRQMESHSSTRNWFASINRVDVCHDYCL